MDNAKKELSYFRKTDTSYRSGISYTKRVKAVNEIYDRHVKSGLTNREIYRRYIYPTFGITEATFYNYLKKAAYM